MPSLARTVLALGLLGVPTVVASVSAPAHAQDSVFSDLFIELMPSGEVSGDGVTPVSYHLVALDQAGQPLSGLQAKVTASAGTAGKLTELKPGVYRFEWTAPATKQARDVQISIKGRTADKQSFARTWAVAVSPPLAQQMTLAANPPQLTLGQDTAATITVNLSGGAAAMAQDTDLVVLSSVGTVANLTPLGNGQWTALFTPPQQQFPQLAILTLADRRDPTRTYGHLVLPMVGKANFPVTGMPNSRILVKLGGRDFGPIQADASGRARVPIVVPPGVSQATVVSILGDKKTEEPLDLQIPATSRARLFPMHASLAADPSISVPVRAYVAKASGEDDPSAKVSFSVTAGTVTAARHEGNGIYVATYTPPLGNTATEATLQVTVEDATGPQTDGQTIHLIPARPSSIVLTPEPKVLPKGADGFKLFAKVQGSDGVGLSGRKLSFVASGAKVQGKTSGLGGGDYQAQFATTGSGPVELIATVKSPASANPLRRVIALPSRARLPNDGLSSTMITVLSLDEFGYPVADVPVELKVLQGDGSVPKQATTDGSGMVQVHYTAGRAAGLVNIQVKAGEHVGNVGILQAPNSVAADLSLPISGDIDSISANHAWRAIVSTVRIDREGLVGAPVKATAKVEVGPVSRITVASEPASVAPGGTVTLRVQAQDTDGQGKAGETFEFVTSAGTLGPVQDLGGGRYQTTLTVPAGVAGDVKVSVAAPETSIAGFLKIPVAGGSAWGTVAPATAATQPAATQPTATQPAATTPAPATGTQVATTQQVEQKAKRESSAFPWLRLEAGYRGGLYSYQQNPLTTTGPLYNQPITVGGDSGSPGGAAGLGVRARAFLPPMDWLGIDAAFRTARWSMQLDTGFKDPIPDWVNDARFHALARHSFDSGANRYYTGVRVGAAFNDFLIFKQELDNGQPVLHYENLIVTGFDAGVEAGAEVGKLYGVASLDMGLLEMAAPYSWASDLTVGYAVLDKLTVHGNLGHLSRNTPVYSDPTGTGEKRKVGELKDNFFQFGLGVGYQL